MASGRIKGKNLKRNGGGSSGKMKELPPPSSAASNNNDHGKFDLSELEFLKTVGMYCIQVDVGLFRNGTKRVLIFMTLSCHRPASRTCQKLLKFKFEWNLSLDGWTRYCVSFSIIKKENKS